MLTHTAKSHSSANANIANVMVQEERRNCLQYVLPVETSHEIYGNSDTTLDIISQLTRQLQSAIPLSSPDGLSNHENVQLIPPARKHYLTNHQQHCLQRYIATISPNSEFPIIPMGRDDHDESTDDSDQDSADESNLAIPDGPAREIPNVCRRFAAAKFSNFSVVSQMMERSDSTRCSYVVRYEHKTAMTLQSLFARVLLFLEVTINGHDEPHRLAFVRRIHVNPEGRLVAIVREGNHHVIDATEIKELMRIMTWEGVDYLLNGKTSLLEGR